MKLKSKTEWNRKGHRELNSYNIIAGTGDTMFLLRDLFPGAIVDEMNFVLFSTSGVHGTYNTIEEAEASLALPEDHDERDCSITFLIVHPRWVTLRYGNVEVKSLEDVNFLKALRANSHRIIKRIGTP